MFAAVVTEPVSAGSAFGLIYMDPRRYPYLCGHASIGAVTTFIEAGWLPATAPETRLQLDTPSGPVFAAAAIDGGRVSAVAIRTVPSFVYRTGETVVVSDRLQLSVDTVCVGGFFAMVSAEQLDFPLTLDNTRRLVDLGMRIIDAANRQLSVRHPLRPEVRSIDVVEFYDPHLFKSAVVYGEGHMDRSPCGTGTAAKLTLMHHRGELDAGRRIVNESLLGMRFDARIARELAVGAFSGVEVEISGSAYITGIHEFIVDDRDPLPEGFLL
jgi:proline racemase